MAASATCASAQSKPSRSLSKSQPRFLELPLSRFLDGATGQGRSDAGELNDHLRITVTGLKPNFAFDLFTVQRSPFEPDGSPVQTFAGFGLAWYQTDLQADDSGKASARIRTILLDQIFGFDGDKRDDGSTILPPTNTFHVGFWFNNPEDAEPCGFDTSKPTPFNGEHKAGPLAMISLPEPASNSGRFAPAPQGSIRTIRSRLRATRKT